MEDNPSVPDEGGMSATPEPSKKLATLDKRLATSKQHEEESLKRLTMLDERLRRLEQLDNRLSQLKAHQALPLPYQPQVSNQPSTTFQTDSGGVGVALRGNAVLLPPIEMPGQATVANAQVETEPLREIVRQEIEAILAVNKLVDDDQVPIKYSGERANLAANLSSIRPQGPSKHDNFNGAESQRPPSRSKVAWAESIHIEHNEKAGENQTRDVNPSNRRMSIQSDTGTFKSSHEGTFKSEVAEISLKDIYAQVESRKALEKDQGDLHHASENIKEAKTLEEATPLSMPYLFGGFTRQSPVRIKCFQMHKSVKWKAFFIVVNMANCLEITLIPELNKDSFNNQSGATKISRRTTASGGSTKTITPQDIFEYCSVLAIAFEILVGSIALGFVRGKTAWLRCSYFHKLDFVILLLAGLEYFLIYSQGILYFSFRAFRLLRLLQPLLRMKMFRDVKEILETLSQGAGQLLTITLVLFLFFLAFSVFGMTIYEGSFRRRCVTIDHLVPICATSGNFDLGNCTWPGKEEKHMNSSRRSEELSIPGWEVEEGGEPVIAGGYPFEKLCKIYYNTTPNQYHGKYPLDPSGHYYHDCGLETFPELPADSTCANVENPAHGFMHYDHIGGTLLAIARYSLVDGAYEVLWASLESEPDAQPLSWIFYLLLTCINTFLVLGLFLAVIANTFQEVRRLKERGKQERERGEATLDGDQTVSRFHEAVESLVEKKRKEAEEDEEDDGAMLLTGWATSVLDDQRFKHLISCTIIVHVAAMSAGADTSPNALDKYVQYVYYIANGLFAAEVLLRFTATGGSKNFFSSEFNLLEFVLVACGLLGLVTGNKILTLIPCIRLFRLAQYWPTLQDLLLDSIETIGAFLNLLMFVGLVCMCFAVAGRYIFRGEMDSITRSNFGELGQALLTIFQIFTGDSWSVVLYDAMSSKPDTGQQFYAAVFVIIWLLMSRVIFSDLFVAVLIENFEIAETVRLIAEPGRISSFRNYLKTSYKKFRDVLANVDPSVHNDVGSSVVDYRSTMTSSFYQSGTVVHASTQLQLLLDAVTASPHRTAEQVADSADELEEHTLFLFGPKHSARIFSKKLTKNPIFQMVIYASIFISCIMLMATPPAEDVPGLSGGPFPLWVRQACDKILTAVFSVEFVASIISQGFILSRNAYLRNGWNVVDFIILFLSLMDLSGLVKGSLAKICRLGRALRPLRLVKRNKGLREMMEALFATLPPLGYVIALWTLLFTVFAIIGMGVFGGLMYRCNFDAQYPEGKIECTGAAVDMERGILLPRAWFNPPYHFDSLYQATLTLFRINTVKFIDILRAGMDITAQGISPKENHSALNSLFFVAYLIVGAFFVMNVFIAFIVDGFNLNRGSSTVDICHNKYLRQIESYAPREKRFRPPKNEISQSFRRLTESNQFKTFSLACVGCNVGFMLAEHADASPSFVALMNGQNLIFFVELVFEVFINLIAYGPGGFIDDSWKCFDFLVMVGSGIGYMSENGLLSKAAKAFRLFRVIRLMRMIKAIRSILETMLSSLPQFGNILLLLFLVYSMFATLFVQLFGLTKYGLRLGPTAQFDTFSHSIVTCYQIVTGDEWMMIMDDVSVGWPECTELFDSTYVYQHKGPQYTWGDCGKSYARYFFIAFKLICESILLNLFIGVILEKFGFITDEISHKEDRAWSSGASGTQFLDFVHTFEKFAGGSHMTSVNAATTTLLFTQMIPLGFRTYDGGYEYEENERACQKLIRAELNVILRIKHLNEAKSRQKYRWIRPLTKLFRSKTKSRFANGVTFDEVARTLLYWRKPSLTPDSIKLLRRHRIEEVLVMNAALTIVDFFRVLVARRKQVDTANQLAIDLQLKRWMSCDSPCLRRMQHYATVRDDQANLAAAKRIPRSKLLSSAAKTVTVDMMPAIEMDEGISMHDDTVRHKMKVPRPKHGLESFRHGATTELVMARFVDTVNDSFVQIDMRPWDWLGWKAAHEERDSFLCPERVSPGGREETLWSSLELAMTTDGALTEVWVLLDVHSFLDDTWEGGVRKSVVRIHLGRKAAMMQSSKQRETLVAGVLEVVGYVAAELPAEPARVVSPRRFSPRRFSPGRISPGRRGASPDRRALSPARQLPKAFE